MAFHPRQLEVLCLAETIGAGLNPAADKRIDANRAIAQRQHGHVFFRIDAEFGQSRSVVKNPTRSRAC